MTILESFNLEINVFVRMDILKIHLINVFNVTRVVLLAKVVLHFVYHVTLHLIYN